MSRFLKLQLTHGQAVALYTNALPFMDSSLADRQNSGLDAQDWRDFRTAMKKLEILLTP